MRLTKDFYCSLLTPNRTTDTLISKTKFVRLTTIRKKTTLTWSQQCLQVGKLWKGYRILGPMLGDSKGGLTRQGVGWNWTVFITYLWNETIIESKSS